MTKKDWIFNARISFNPGPRMDCCVCGKFADIAQAHHIYPLSAQYDDGSIGANHDIVWLCPNHHAVLHFIISYEGKCGSGYRGLRDISDEEDGILWCLVDRYYDMRPSMIRDAAE